MLAAFRVRSFRFQWPADLLTSWAFEMETLILGWYVMVATGSVVSLAIIGALNFLGTLVAPVFGVAGDRLGRRTVMCVMRGFYATLAVTMMVLGLTDTLTPDYVFGIAFLSGMVRPSDLSMRNALIGDTMPPETLTNAMGLSRTTQDSARVAGSLVGAGLFSTLGIGPSYMAIAAFYAVSFAFTFGVTQYRADDAADGAGGGTAAKTPMSPWRDIVNGFVYCWKTPKVLALMWLAFLVNLFAYPVTHGLLPFVAREIYHLDANGLGRMVASFAVGALGGSLAIAWLGTPRRPDRFTLVNIFLWFILVIAFGFVTNEFVGNVLLLLIGIVQGLSMIALAVTLLTTVEPRYRGCAMGVRMLVVYGLPVGLMTAGKVIEVIGFPATLTIYGVTGIVLSMLVGIYYRASLWHQ
jgi:MFS family permease